MLVILKTIGGLDTPLSNGKTLTLKGCSVINDIDNDLWKIAKENDTIKDMLEKGFIVESTKSENALTDMVDDIKTKQTKDKESAKQKNKAKVGVDTDAW